MINDGSLPRFRIFGNALHDTTIFVKIDWCSSKDGDARKKVTSW